MVFVRLYVRTADGIAMVSEDLTAAFEYDPSEPKTGQPITFDAAPSGPEQLIPSYDWSIGGRQMTGETVQTTFEEINNYTVELTVYGDNGLTDTVERRIKVEGQSPTAVIEYAPSEPKPNERVTFTGANSVDPDGEIVSYRWLIGTEAKSGEQVQYTFDRAGTFQLQLTVEDETGKEHTARQALTVSEPTPDPTTPTPMPLPANGTDDKIGGTDDQWLPIGTGALATLTGIAGWLHFGRDVPEGVHPRDKAESDQPPENESEENPSGDESEPDTE